MFAFLIDLCESHLIPSRTSLRRWDSKKLSELAYLYFLGLHILLCDKEHTWASEYCKKAGNPNDFSEWRQSSNDLYVFLHALSPDNEDSEVDLKKINISPTIIRHWLRHVSVHNDKTVQEETRKLFVRLDTMFHIENSAMKSMRRIITDWDDATAKEQQDTITKLIQLIHARAPSNSEILPHLKKLDKVTESATSGATGASSVATVVGGLGAGFDPNGDRGVYANKKPVIIRRNNMLKDFASDEPR